MHLTPKHPHFLPVLDDWTVVLAVFLPSSAVLLGRLVVLEDVLTASCVVVSVAVDVVATCCVVVFTGCSAACDCL